MSEPLMRRAWAFFSVLVLLAVPANAYDAVLSGSASVDYRYVSGPIPPLNPSPLGINGLTVEVAQKVVVDIGHGVSFSAKACGGCHGIEIDQAYGEVSLARGFNLRVGRLNVPFGEFTVRHDPSNFSTPSRPLPFAMGDMLQYGREGFNLGIVPAPYVDNGVEIFGSLSLGQTTQFDYSLYAVKGLAGDNDLDFARSRTYVDNNRLPAGGARLVLTGDNWALGGSVNGGTYDAADKLSYLMAGLELYLRLGPVTFRAEALGRRTDLDPKAAGYRFVLTDAWFLKAGWYAQLDFELGSHVTAVLRTDGLQRLGMPLPGSDLLESSSGVQRQTAALLLTINQHLAAKLDYELWTFSGVAYPMRHVVRVGLVFGY